MTRRIQESSASGLAGPKHRQKPLILKHWLASGGLWGADSLKSGTKRVPGAVGLRNFRIWGAAWTHCEPHWVPKVSQMCSKSQQQIRKMRYWTASPKNMKLLWKTYDERRRLEWSKPSSRSILVAKYEVWVFRKKAWKIRVKMTAKSTLGAGASALQRRFLMFWAGTRIVRGLQVSKDAPAGCQKITWSTW